MKFLNPAAGFTVAVGQHVDVRLQVNECGSNRAVTSGSVVMDFTNGDPELALTHQGNGLWQTRWTPATAVDGDVKISTFVVGSNGAIDGIQLIGTVTPPAPPITFDKSTLVFQATAGGVRSSQTVTVFNNGSQSQTMNIQATGGTWVSASPSSVAVPAGGSAPVEVDVDPASLAPGNLSGAVTVTAGTASSSALVSVAVAAPANPPQLTLDVWSLSLTLTQGDTSSPTLQLSNGNASAVDFTAVPSAAWIDVTPKSGTIAAGKSVSLQVVLDAGDLAPGVYGGSISITPKGGLANVVPVTLTVVARPPAVPKLMVDPAALNFAVTAGGSPQTQTIKLSNQNALAVNYSVSIAGAGLAVTPASGTVAANGSAAIQVTADPKNLTAGSSVGTVTIFAVATGGVSGVQLSVALTVAPQTGTGVCTARQLLLQPLSPVNQSVVTLGLPTTLEVLVTDDCGNRLGSTAASVKADFSNGDAAVTMAGIGNGVFQGTWLPRGGVASQTVTILFSAGAVAANSTLLASQVSVSVKLGLATAAPTVASIVSAASFAGVPVVAPGELVSIFGNQLGDCVASSKLPYPTQSCATQLMLGNALLPLFFVSPTQINAQIPFGIPVNVQAQLVVQRGTAVSVPTAVAIAAAQPGVFALSVKGTGQGAVVNGVTNRLVDSSSPASAGDVLVIYCTGLGAVTPAVPSGAPVTSISLTTNQTTVMIGGKPATVQFAGLAPGFVGLYQVNVVMPSGVTPGNSVPLIVTVANQSSPVTTIAVK